jgi:hypothetical protein
MSRISANRAGLNPSEDKIETEFFIQGKSYTFPFEMYNQMIADCVILGWDFLNQDKGRGPTSFGIISGVCFLDVGDIHIPLLSPEEAPAHMPDVWP